MRAERTQPWEYPHAETRYGQAATRQSRSEEAEKGEAEGCRRGLPVRKLRKRRRAFEGASGKEIVPSGCSRTERDIMSQQTLHPDRDPRQLQQALWRWDNEGGAGPAAPGDSPLAIVEEDIRVFRIFIDGLDTLLEAPSPVPPLKY